MDCLLCEQLRQDLLGLGDLRQRDLAAARTALHEESESHKESLQMYQRARDRALVFKTALLRIAANDLTFGDRTYSPAELVEYVVEHRVLPGTTLGSAA